MSIVGTTLSTIGWRLARVAQYSVVCLGGPSHIEIPTSFPPTTRAYYLPFLIAQLSSQPIMLLSLHRTAAIVVSLSIWTLSVLTLPTTSPLPSRLNITTIGAANGKSTLECWQLSAPLVPSNQPGVVGSAVAQLGETGATSYTLLPPQYEGGLHNAPAVQYVSIRFFLPGHFSLVLLATIVPNFPRYLNSRRANPSILGALDGWFFYLGSPLSRCQTRRKQPPSMEAAMDSS